MGGNLSRHEYVVEDSVVDDCHYDRRRRHHSLGDLVRRCGRRRRYYDDVDLDYDDDDYDYDYDDDHGRYDDGPFPRIHHQGHHHRRRHHRDDYYRYDDYPLDGYRYGQHELYQSGGRYALTYGSHLSSNCFYSPFLLHFVELLTPIAHMDPTKLDFGYPKARPNYTYVANAGAKGTYMPQGAVPNGAPGTYGYGYGYGYGGGGYGYGYPAVANYSVGFAYPSYSGNPFHNAYAYNYPFQGHHYNYHSAHSPRHFLNAGYGHQYQYQYPYSYGMSSPYYYSSGYYPSTYAYQSPYSYASAYSYPMDWQSRWSGRSYAAIPDEFYCRPARAARQRRPDPDFENRRIATERGAYEPKRIRPADREPDAPFWCRELDGTWKLRPMYDIEESCYPGQWKMNAEKGYLVFERH
ncbi:hypothetical protein BDV96DRAFT_648034 [Lophiotrema nucula]|uniref:Uncharacterized protein n=1 Tax=Lophiotrema nucula TaxID=690887 RepID=A0A6A5Z643_9PLEO|nr:hypothetical protein BDV96DRAFT_648034 [Lophiotrema nucula]